MNLYCVVNVDIVKSRSVKDREKLQEIITQLLINLNDRFANVLTVPVAVTIGDEFQGLLNDPSQSYNYVHYIQQHFWKYNLYVYAGIGIGEISTSINTDVRMMDGPCFHIAREAINSAKNVMKDRSNNTHNKKNRVYFQEDNNKTPFLGAVNSFYTEAIRETAATVDTSNYVNQQANYSLGDIINTLIENNEILKSKLTTKQKKAYVDYIQYGSYRKMLEAYPEEDRETIGAISQKLNSAEYFTIRRNHDMVSFLLELYCFLRGQIQ